MANGNENGLISWILRFTTGIMFLWKDNSSGFRIRLSAKTFPVRTVVVLFCVSLLFVSASSDVSTFTLAISTVAPYQKVVYLIKKRSHLVGHAPLILWKLVAVVQIEGKLLWTCRYKPIQCQFPSQECWTHSTSKAALCHHSWGHQNQEKRLMSRVHGGVWSKK